jgi:MEDS: MEthanogen/methylotroph, DcmR Sensory domain
MRVLGHGNGRPHLHAVQFYSSDETLFTTVAGFLAEGLVIGQPAIVIATRSHCAAIVNLLGRRLIDCERALREGDLLLLDVETTLDLFMVDGVPRADLFEKNIGRLVDQALNGRSGLTIRAFGEMVNVLWKQQRYDVAIALESLWNTLAPKYDFALLCGYSMGSFCGHPSQLEDVIAQHSHVVAQDMNVVPFARNQPRRE